MFMYKYITKDESHYLDLFYYFKVDKIFEYCIYKIYETYLTI